MKTLPNSLMQTGLAALIVLFIGAAFPVFSAEAQTALIVAAEGEISPSAEEFSEADEGARFVMSDGAQMIVLHYAACVETHFRGGELTIGALGFETTGEVASETTVECPRKVAFSEDANTVAAVVLRGGEDRTLINSRPVFVLLGPGVERIEIRRGGALVGALDIDGRLARWPAGEAALEPASDYEIALLMGGDAKTADAAVAADAGITIIDP